MLGLREEEEEEGMWRALCYWLCFYPWRWLAFAFEYSLCGRLQCICCAIHLV